MVDGVTSMVYEFEIVGSIVGLVFIDMMDPLRSSEWPSQHALHHDYMFQHIPTIAVRPRMIRHENGDITARCSRPPSAPCAIARPSSYIPTIRGIAGLRAVPTTTLLHSGFITGEELSTIGAGERYGGCRVGPSRHRIPPFGILVHSNINQRRAQGGIFGA